MARSELPDGPRAALAIRQEQNAFYWIITFSSTIRKVRKAAHNDCSDPERGLALALVLEYNGLVELPCPCTRFPAGHLRQRNTGSGGGQQ
jgi:hypothetical protein